MALNFAGAATNVLITETWSGFSAVNTGQTAPNKSFYNTFTSNLITNNIQTATTANYYYTYEIRGTMKITSAGILKAQMASFSAGTQTITAQAGSYIAATKIG